MRKSIAYLCDTAQVKRALVDSSREHMHPIFISTYGILFLGTPHIRSGTAEYIHRLELICAAAEPENVPLDQKNLRAYLDLDFLGLQKTDQQFTQLINRYRTYFFHETRLTNLHGVMRFIVNEKSASPDIKDVERAGIYQDHSHMCKFENEYSPGFDLIADGIQRYSNDAPVCISRSWESVKKEPLERKEIMNQEWFPSMLVRRLKRSDD